MIKADFYPTQTTEPNTGNQVTNTLNQLNIPAASEAYWLGWIKPENTPSAFKFSSYSVSPQQIQFFDVTEENNYDIGYLSGYNTSNATWSNIVLPNNPINTQLVRYINKLDCMGVGISYGNVSLRFRVYVESGLSNDEMTGRTVREFGSPSLNTWQYMSMKDFYDFLNGDYTLQLTVQGFYGGSSTVNINLSNADKMGVVYVETTSEYNGVTYYDHIYFTIADYMFTTMRSQTAVYGTNGQSMSVVPAIGINANDKYFVSCTNSGLKSATVGAMNFDGTWYGTSWNNNNTGFSFGVLVANPIGTIPASLKTQSGFAIFTGNIMVWNRANVRFEISRVFTADDILKHLSLFPRIVIDGDATAPNPQYGYYENHSYATHVRDTNEFLAELITGDLTDDTFKEKLRLWQWDNAEWEENNYTEDDRPPYEPGPEPSDDIHGRHTGSTGSLYGSGVGAVSNFVTHWVLDASQVQTFGGHLWKDLLDFDAQGEPIGTQLWKNAKIAVNTYFQTGSFDPGSILELLIGLRYFPINLAKADYATQMTVPAVYFGTGRVGVDVTTNPWKLNDCGIYITGGDMDLSQLSWNKYDDWRDVYNVSASIYIPFCGTYELPWADIYNGTLHLSYGVDVLSGALTAFVECTLGLNRFLVCVGSGMVGFEVPITATNANRINAAILGDMGNMMGTLFNPSDAAKLTSSLVGAETGSSAGIPTGDSEPTVTNAAGSAPIVGQAALAGRVAEIHAGIASRPGITCPALPGGRGWGALTGQRIPFITVRKGRYVEGTGYGHAAGYPRMKIESIGNMSGYTQCINPDLSGIDCTRAEKDMIKQILETGFYA